MAQISLNINGKARVVDADSSTPLLYVLRDNLDCMAPDLAAAWASAEHAP